MRISEVNFLNNKNNNPLQFKSLSLTKNGAYHLAGYFVENPGFEDVFMKQIAQPLEKAQTKVLFEGAFVKFTTPIREGIYSVLKRYDKNSSPYALVTEYIGGKSGRRIPYYLNALKNPTDNFTNAGHIFDEFEAVKNIAENAELMLKGHNSKNKQEISRLNETAYNNKLKRPGDLMHNGQNYYISYDKYSQKAQELMERFPEIKL